jgi:hypothetical protein
MAEFKAAECTSPLCDVVGIVITLLQVGQVIPQHFEMIADKTTAGLSPWLLFFGSLYSYLAFIDAVMSGASDFACGAGPYRCFMSAQPFIQMLLTAVLTFGLWFWFLRYYDNSEEVSELVTSGRSRISCLGHTCDNLLSPQMFFQLTLFCAGFATFVAFAISFTGSPEMVVSFAHVCGNLAAALNAVMWLPQILLTATYGHRGALSIHWVIATIIMDVVYSVYLAEMGLDISVWLNNIPDGVQTTVLLGILIYYERRDIDLGLDDFGHPLATDLVSTDSHAENVTSLANGDVRGNYAAMYGAVATSDDRENS